MFFVFSLDPETKDQLIEIIERLLSDKTTVRNQTLFILIYLLFKI